MGRMEFGSEGTERKKRKGGKKERVEKRGKDRGRKREEEREGDNNKGNAPIYSEMRCIA